MTKYPSQLQDKFNLRFPDGMRDDIAERAKANGRSMNSEIISILEERIYATNDDLRDLSPEEMKEAISKQVPLLMKQAETIEKLSEKIDDIAKILIEIRKPV